MAKKGSIRRLNSSQNELPEEKVSLNDEMPHIWKRGQDHFNRFTKLIKIELDDETALVEERWKKWNKQRLVAAGLTLFELTARSQGRFLGIQLLFLNCQINPECLRIDLDTEISF